MSYSGVVCLKVRATGLEVMGSDEKNEELMSMWNFAMQSQINFVNSIRS
jgi:hypothetical protein